MSQSSQTADLPLGPLPFEAFLLHLRRQGFTIGIDHHLRLQQLLTRVGDQCAPSDLKTTLCPIFASSAEQQAAFYAAFDAHFELFLPAGRRVSTEPVEEAAEKPGAAPPRT